MTFNEFQRELQKRNISPENAYMFTLIYERLGQLLRQQDDYGKALIGVVNSVRGFVGLHEETQRRVRQIERGGRPEGVDVESVGYDPEEIEKNRKN